MEIPKFSAVFEAELSDALRDLGIREAFTDQANFRTVTTGTPVSLSLVAHKVELSVQEGVCPTETERRHEQTAEIAFLVNRPFILCMRKLDLLVLLACVQRIPQG